MVDTQVDFEGSKVPENEADEPERWELDPKLHKEIAKLIHTIKEFSFIDPATIQCVVTNKDKKAKFKKDWHQFAEIMKVKPIFQAIAQEQKAVLGPFVILFRPIYFKQSDKQKEQTRIHELFHLRLNENSGKVSLRGHYGFGDGDIEALQRKYL